VINLCTSAGVFHIYIVICLADDKAAIESRPQAELQLHDSGACMHSGNESLLKAIKVCWLPWFSPISSGVCIRQLFAVDASYLSALISICITLWVKTVR